jgi:hypothetical protein
MLEVKNRRKEMKWTAQLGFIFALVILIFATGCVSQDDYDALQKEYDALMTSYETLSTRSKLLESTLTDWQTAYATLQKQTATSPPTAKTDEPASGKWDSHCISGEGLSCSINKYVNWQTSTIQCNCTQLPNAPMHVSCRVGGAITNNHPSLTMTGVNINGMGAPGTTIKSGKTAPFLAVIPLSPLSDQQLILRWQWQ